MNPLMNERAMASWEAALHEKLPLFGHRNWIVVADSAYPMQSEAGITTIVADAGQVEILQAVLDALGASKHVKPIVYVDRELDYVQEEDAPGVSVYRSELKELLGGKDVRVIPHEEIIRKLDEVARTFGVLILKSNLTIPYTSVFLELDCAYWSQEAEARLRALL